MKEQSKRQKRTKNKKKKSIQNGSRYITKFGICLSEIPAVAVIPQEAASWQKEQQA